MFKYLTPRTKTETEYRVYIHYPDIKEKRRSKWEKASVTNDMILALEQARMLLESGKYEKIEVQKKFYCPTEQKNICQTLKTYSTHQKSAIRKTTLTILGSISSAALAAFLCSSIGYTDAH